MKKYQAELSTIIIFIAVAVMLAAAGGWYIWRKHYSNPPFQKGTPITKVYTDTSKFYTLKYPASSSYKEAADCCEGSPKDWSVVPRPVDFVAPDSPGGNKISVQADKTGALAALVQKNWKDNDHTPQQLTINGNQVLYVQVEFKGDAESYTDDNYLILNKNKGSVFLTFREKYQHNGKRWDDLPNLTGFKALVGSITFLN